MNILNYLKLFLFCAFCLFTSSLLHAQDAAQVIFSMNIKGIDFVYPFDESNDPNDQLGRPNQYIDKVSWPDPRIDPKFESDGYYDPDTNPTEFKGGTLEKFKNISDLNRRYNYIKRITLQMPVYNQYMYKRGLYLLRLDKEFTPTQAKEYEQKFYKVVK
ncbi:MULTISPECIES: hypothetical protein [unclassified Acinetobacter]|uniref:hypothetical protein n=1 Tax=unclassified Acinetobacter TaxID=196816 RepID=UPI00190B5FAA|nr:MULTISPECIES: hypothetical protein [unclassified Acinetobacter]MBK0062601.1 hypothetical protein [Acinetobacter sp. S55]MBK0065822.1 hypothetical protein [Acinetobacter sp. S54]